MITHIKTQAVYVSDQQKALAFYTEILGFELRRNEPMGPAGGWVEVSPTGGQSRIVLYPRELMGDWERRASSIVFACEDIEATHRDLKARGVPFQQEPRQMPWGKFAVFSDPDGNEFVLAEGD